LGGKPSLLQFQLHQTEQMKLLAAFFSFVLVSSLLADSSRDEQIAERFAAADTNHDGQLTLAEAQAGMPRVAANFSKIDADQSGTVTIAEIEALADR
jgi:hypothetical protein